MLIHSRTVTSHIMSISRHTLYNIGGSVLPMVVAIATIPLYLSKIGSERYGVLAIIWALLSYFGFFDLGFGRAVTQHMARLASSSDGDERSNLLWTALITTFALGCTASIVLVLGTRFFLVNHIAISNGIRGEVADAVLWLIFSLPALLPTGVLIGALQARFRFAEVNLVQSLCGILGQLLPLWVASSGCVELGILVPTVLSSRILLFILLLILARKFVSLKGVARFDIAHFGSLFIYGKWISVSAILGPLLVTIDRLFIASLSGPKAVTFYTVPYDLVSRSLLISNSFSSALFPRFALSGSVGSRDLCFRSTFFLSAIVTPVTIIGIFLANPFLSFWMGSSFAEASRGVPELLLLGVWLNSFAIPSHTELMANGSPKRVAIIYIVQVPVYLIALWLGINFWGIRGAAGAWAFRLFLDTFIFIFLGSSFLEIVKIWLRYVFFVFVSLLIVSFLRANSSMYWIFGFLIISFFSIINWKYLKLFYFEISKLK